jgi:hypothetical protein
MTKQEIAKHLDNLNWGKIQCDSPDEGYKLEFLIEELNKLPREEATNILLAVIEAQNLPDDFMGENRVMHEFRNI